jgi:hypothetical protein
LTIRDCSGVAIVAVLTGAIGFDVRDSTIADIFASARRCDSGTNYA